MSADEQDIVGRGLLRGWKAIAAYLGTSSRSAQRYAAELGMPVHRTGRVQGGVTAFPDELDAWTRQRAANAAAEPSALPPAAVVNPSPERGGRWRRPVRGVVIGILLAVLGVFAWYGLALRTKPGPIDGQTTPATTVARQEPQPAGDEARPGARATTFLLWFRLPTGRVIEMRVAEGVRSPLTIGPSLGFQVQARMRDGRLRVRLLNDPDIGGRPPTDSSAGAGLDLVRTERGQPMPVQVQFEDTALEVAWVNEQVP